MVCVVFCIFFPFCPCLKAACSAVGASLSRIKKAKISQQAKLHVWGGTQSERFFFYLASQVHPRSAAAAPPSVQECVTPPSPPHSEEGGGGGERRTKVVAIPLLAMNDLDFPNFP